MRIIILVDRSEACGPVFNMLTGRGLCSLRSNKSSNRLSMRMPSRNKSRSMRSLTGYEFVLSSVNGSKLRHGALLGRR
jgi:hypothetical protein